MSRVKDNSYIVIQSFMATDLKLKGNELMVYAIIYGFSQDGEQSFTGSALYLADWCSSTRQSILKVLKSLQEKQLITKKEVFVNGVKFCEYQSTKFTGGVNKVDRGVSTKFTGGCKQSLHNNLGYNLNNKIDNKKKNKILSNSIDYNQFLEV